MAKTAIVRVGVEADPSGLGSVRGQVNRSLNTMAAQFGTIRGLMTSAMALPAIGMLTSIVEARSEAREMAKDLMMPFSQALQGSKAYDIGRRMDVGQQMTALGLDEFLARSEQRKTEVDIAKGLQAQPTGDAEKAFGSIWLSRRQPSSGTHSTWRFKTSGRASTQTRIRRNWPGWNSIRHWRWARGRPISCIN
jgi:hypothetical protein